MRPVADSAHWQLTWASVQGKSHLAARLPNQDRVEVRTTQHGNVIGAAVSDGAGSAAQSHVGARITCEIMAECMLEVGIKLQHCGVGADYVRERIERGLCAVRDSLSRMSHKLSDYHCTLVACVLTDHAGYVCQLGDSVALCTGFAGIDDLDNREIDFFPDSRSRLFQPDRGEYANETHFITEPDWAIHLRITPLDMANLDALMLMSDGAMDVATSRGKVFRGFLSNLIGKLLTLPAVADRERLLTEWLADSRSHRATADDKTMFVAIRAAHLKLANKRFRVDSDSTAPEIPAGTEAPTGQQIVVQNPLARKNGAHATESRPGTALQILHDTQPSAHGGSLLDRLIIWLILPILGIGVALLGAALLIPTWPDHSAWSPTNATMPSTHSEHSARAATHNGERPGAAAAHRTAEIGHASPDDGGHATPHPVPASAPPEPAQLVVLPNDRMELVVPEGATTRLRLRMIVGREAELISVSSSEASALRVETGPAGCSPQDHITYEQPDCIIQLRALKSNSKTTYRLQVVYRDPVLSEPRTLILPVRLAKGEPK
jgi:serine/threonine protein phosphatase PrpC